ncbi:hypothetical protein [Pseudomonas brassicacearum]|uniref:hypothetical protein n=1 Tax=Pseudomonas brassicacearum TaxID=930166 RepID=UPI0006404AA2|nr:hypothetical protein [Pseudomonas brassicacearum]
MNAYMDAQAGEARMFVTRNDQWVKLVERLLKRATGVLVEKVCRKAMTESELQVVKHAVERGDLYKVFSLVRPGAEQMRRIDSMNIYWDWIDAFGGYSDAVGSCWPYMSQERRAYALVHAEELANAICK